jgi:hypothetical protein
MCQLNSHSLQLLQKQIVTFQTKFLFEREPWLPILIH